MRTTALIAEDESLLAQALQLELGQVWPDLQICAMAADGQAAVDLALEHRPDVVFMDIRMPGQTGLEAAQALLEDWPDEHPLPLLVFVTAFDQYALRAFEAHAVDYLLKPVQPPRLQACCERLKALLAQRQQPQTPALDESVLSQLRHLLTQGVSAPVAAAPLQVLQASAGATVHLIPVDDIIYFEAADKYIRVLTAEREHLIRLSLRELLPQLPAERFWQIHRSTVVQIREVSQAVRDESGKTSLVLRRRPERLAVSRVYAGRFKGL